MNCYLPFLQQVLTPKRFDHSVGVMQVMADLTEVYDLDRERALTAGILHDAAKDLPPACQKRLIEEGKISLSDTSEQDYVLYLHAPVGAFFVQKELGIQDKLILAAIATHCYFGDSPFFDHPLSWCLRFADILEPTRVWTEEKLLLEGSQRLRKLVYAGELMDAARFISAVIVNWYELKGFPIHPNLRRIGQPTS